MRIFSTTMSYFFLTIQSLYQTARNRNILLKGDKITGLMLQSNGRGPAVSKHVLMAVLIVVLSVSIITTDSKRLKASKVDYVHIIFMNTLHLS